MRSTTRYWKRALDWLLTLGALPVLGPVALVTALVILLDDGGPVLFVQPRLGRGGRTFRIYKFRTMRDGRITRAGRILRSTGLDELPQYLNIARAEMSVVGPRPLTREDAERLGWWTDGRVTDRWTVDPGLTGLAQLNAGEGAERSMMLDLQYIKHMSLALDLEIIAVSLIVNIVGKRSARALLAERIRRLG